MPPRAGFPRAVAKCPDINASYWSAVKEYISLKDGNVASFRGDFLGECCNSEGSGGGRGGGGGGGGGGRAATTAGSSGVSGDASS